MTIINFRDLYDEYRNYQYWRNNGAYVRLVANNTLASKVRKTSNISNSRGNTERRHTKPENYGHVRLANALLSPPVPPTQYTPWHAMNPATPEEELWHIATYYPKLRRWIIANVAATPELLEYIAQCGGPYVRASFEVLFQGLERGQHSGHSNKDSQTR